MCDTICSYFRLLVVPSSLGSLAMEHARVMPRRIPVNDIPHGIRGPISATINALYWTPNGELIMQVFFILPRENLPARSYTVEHLMFVECTCTAAWNYVTFRLGIPWEW